MVAYIKETIIQACCNLFCKRGEMDMLDNIPRFNMKNLPMRQNKK